MRNETTQTAPQPSRRSVRGDILFTFAVAIGLYLAWLLRNVLVLIYVSALFAVVLLPVVRGVQRLRIGNWRPSHGVAILFITVLLIGGIAVFLFLTIPPVLREIKSFVQALPERSPAFVGKLQRLPLLRDIDFGALQVRLKQDTAQHAGTFVSSISDWATKFFEIITGIILTVYFLAEGDHVYHWFLSMVPVQRRTRLDETLQRAAIRMGRWLLGQLMLMLILGILSGIVFGAIHLRYAFALAVLMGSFNIVPVVGAMVSTSLAMLIAAGESWEKVLAVLVFELVYVQIENAYLTPRIMQSSVDLAGIAVFIALLLGGGLAGVAGVLVAVPSAVLIAVLIDEYVIQPANAARDLEAEPIVAHPHMR
ncbi:MAG TPA: AI-2E family transporter [Acidobacteriaceae bacterium]|nr:AI-2E family transporter [Acidobacteriaceae bacterium]